MVNKKKNHIKETHNHVKSHSECDVLADGGSLIAIPNCIPTLSVYMNTEVGA